MTSCGSSFNMPKKSSDWLVAAEKFLVSLNPGADESTFSCCIGGKKVTLFKDRAGARRGFASEPAQQLIMYFSKAQSQIQAALAYVEERKRMSDRGDKLPLKDTLRGEISSHMDSLNCTLKSISLLIQDQPPSVVKIEEVMLESIEDDGAEAVFSNKSARSASGASALSSVSAAGSTLSGSVELDSRESKSLSSPASRGRSAVLVDISAMPLTQTTVKPKSTGAGRGTVLEG